MRVFPLLQSKHKTAITMNRCSIVFVIVLLFCTSVVRSRPIQPNTEIETDVLNRVSADGLEALWTQHFIDEVASQPLSDLNPLFEDQIVTIADDMNTTSTSEPDSKTDQMDPWSMVWYIGSFGGLVTFFLVVSCSECCCTKPAGPPTGQQGPPEAPVCEEGPPPPPYHLFAPPPYDSLFYGITEKDKLDIFVVPVHQPTASPSPPP